MTSFVSSRSWYIYTKPKATDATIHSTTLRLIQTSLFLSLSIYPSFFLVATSLDASRKFLNERETRYVVGPFINSGYHGNFVSRVSRLVGTTIIGVTRIKLERNSLRTWEANRTMCHRRGIYVPSNCRIFTSWI